jgi:hypothetical protein
MIISHFPSESFTAICFALGEYQSSPGVSGHVLPHVMRDLYAIEAASEAETWHVARTYMAPHTVSLLASAELWVQREDSPISRATRVAAADILHRCARIDYNSRVETGFDARRIIEAARIHIVSLRVGALMQKMRGLKEDNHLTRKEVRTALSKIRQELNHANHLARNCDGVQSDWGEVASRAIHQIVGTVEETSLMLNGLKR